MAHATLEKFGYPGSLIREYGHWAVVLRSHQATLGALVLIATSDARSFAGLEPEGYAEMGVVLKHIETGLAAFRRSVFAHFRPSSGRVAGAARQDRQVTVRGQRRGQ